MCWLSCSIPGGNQSSSYAKTFAYPHAYTVFSKVIAGIIVGQINWADVGYRCFDAKLDTFRIAVHCSYGKFDPLTFVCFAVGT